MSMDEEMKLHIKVVINKQNSKVLFAEAGSDFTDVLLSFLLLPLGTILNVMEKQFGVKSPLIGSLTTLYNGVVNLDTIHFHAKQSLIFPASCYESEARKLRLNVVNYPQINSGKTYDGVYTEGAASFIISDDLQVMHNGAGSFMKTLSLLSIDVADLDGAKTKDVAIGSNEILALLRASMIYRNPLTKLLCGIEVGLVPEKFHHITLTPTAAAMSKNTKKMVLKVVIHKSSKKLLFAQADVDFINFLFGILTIPLGRVEWYFGSNSGLTSVDNLHGSITDKMHLKSAEAQELLRMFSHLKFDPVSKNDHVKGGRMYMVRDDLTVTPLSMTSVLSVLNRLKISLSGVEEVEVQVGLEEGLQILKAALTSTTALTDGLINTICRPS